MATEIQQYERMATLEAKLGTIEALLNKLDDKFDNLNSGFVPRPEIDVLFRQRDDKIIQLQTELSIIRQEKQSNKALLPAWAAIAISAAAILIQLLS